MITDIRKDILQYSLGALLYTTAFNNNLADDLYNNKFKGLRSLCICLEDTINDNSILDAEKSVLNTITKIYNYSIQNTKFKSNMPIIFIRIRNPKHLLKIYNMINSYLDIITGFILPKFDLSNACEYRDITIEINKTSNSKIYVMPIIESLPAAKIDSRVYTLKEIRKVVDDFEDYVLNIRIGGNDFCNIFGIRRNIYSTIYDVKVISDIMSDIFNLFGDKYVVSAPVWEFFDNMHDDKWKIGLLNELKFDKINGFIGKTAIHPSQVDIINNSLIVEHSDYEDAKNILNWNDDNICVGRAEVNNRMNEVKVHTKWAEKIMALASIYGVRK